jgi:hypothetical protein
MPNQNGYDITSQAMRKLRFRSSKRRSRKPAPIWPTLPTPFAYARRPIACAVSPDTSSAGGLFKRYRPWTMCAGAIKDSPFDKGARGAAEVF